MHRRIYSISHAVVAWSAAFGRHPVDVLTRVLDVARLAVDAVLCVDL